MGKIRAAVVGYGNIGRFTVEALEARFGKLGEGENK